MLDPIGYLDSCAMGPRFSRMIVIEVVVYGLFFIFLLLSSSFTTTTVVAVAYVIVLIQLLAAFRPTPNILSISRSSQAFLFSLHSSLVLFRFISHLPRISVRLLFIWLLHSAAF
jgi:hypothetical protein